MKIRKMQFQLIPKSAANKNIRTSMKDDQWVELSRVIRAVPECPYCNKEYPIHKMRSHEQWHFDIETEMIQLEDLVPVCDICHRTIHMTSGNEQNRAYVDRYCEVNQISREEAKQDYLDACYKRDYLETYHWKLDIDQCKEFILNKYGFHITLKEE